MDLKKYKNLFEQSPAAEIVIDTNFTIVSATNAFLNNTGTRREDITGKIIFDIFPSGITGGAANEDSMRASFERVLKKKTTDTLTVALNDYPADHSEKENPDVKYRRIIHSPVFDENNEVEFIIQRIEGLTGQDGESESHVESNERFNRLIMQSHFGISVVKGKEMRIALANDLSKERLGIEEDIVGKTLLEVLPEMKDQPIIDLIRQVYTTGDPFSAKEILTKIKRDDGTLENRYFDVVLQPYREADDTISGVTSIAYEVTKLVRARQKVEKSENRYRLLIEESPIATSLYTGPELILQYANDMMLEFMDKSKSVIGMPLIEIMPEFEGQNFIDYLNDVYRTGKSYTGVEEKVELYRNGELQSFYFNFTYKALRDSDGKIYGIHNTAIDVTEQVLAKKALQENEKTLRQLLDSMPQKISHTDSEGNVIFFNRQWTNETGYTLEELKDNKWIRTLHPEDVRNLKEKWISSIREGSYFEVECRIWNKNLGYRWHLNRAVPIKDDEGNIMKWVGSNTDIHDQKTQKEMLEKAVRQRTKDLEHANKELVIQNREIEKQKTELLNANAELESFTYISSHDLQEPLRKIQTFSDLIRDKEKKNLSARGINYFERMEDAAERMRILIDDLLTFSRINNTEKCFKKIDLNKILDDVKENFKEEIERKNATIEIKELCDANVIEFQFRQLMHNLISNSIKFSKPDTPPHIKIENKVISGSQIDNPNIDPGMKYCQIIVRDNGIGFEPEYNKRIFEVFQRLHHRHTYEGTGIGLAIVKKIVENHNGLITATSKPEEGTVICIYIPSE